MRRLVATTCVLVALSVAGVAQADRRVVWVGESSPWVELLRAELSMIDVRVDPAYAPPPRDEAEVRARLDEWDALGIIVSDEPAVLWLPACNGGLHATRVPTLPSPGASTVLIAELLWAHLNEECPHSAPLRAPPPPVARPPVQLAGVSVGALSAPTQSPPATPRVVASLRPDARSSEASSATPEPAFEAAARFRYELHVDVLTGRDDLSLTPRLALGVGGAVQLHPHMALVAHGWGGSGRQTDAPFSRASTLAAGVGLRASLPVGSWRLSAEGGPSVVWVRAAFDPNLGYDPQTAAFAGYHFGAAIELPLVGRFRLRLVSRLTNTGRRRDLTLAHRQLGHWGPIFQGGLGLAATL